MCDLLKGVGDSEGVSASFMEPRLTAPGLSFSENEHLQPSLYLRDLKKTL
jgi:hypothetical protein